MSYKGNKHDPVAVWVFVWHSSGKLSVTQTVVNKENFKEVQRGMKGIKTWIADNLRKAKSCPYHPKGPGDITDDDPPSTATQYFGPGED